MSHPIDRRLSVAPMMECTDRHERFFLRLITTRTLLYTEMVTTGAVLHGDRERLLAYDPVEHPLALQVGGSSPTELAKCARIAHAMGYDEINLNVGCPSGRVQSGRFGACLMAEPDLVASCVAAMADASPLPVTVKTRIGIDERDSFEELLGFVDAMASAGCRVVIIHARKAWLSGLSPKENREVPPLRYDVVYRLKRERPALSVVLNGGVQNLAEAHDHLREVDGVMIGRAAYETPYVLAEADRRLWGDERPVPTRRELLDRFVPYVEEQVLRGVPLNLMARHLAGLLHGEQGAKLWRRRLGELCRKDSRKEALRELVAAFPAF